MREIDILLFNGINLLDVAGPTQAFTFAAANNVSFYNTRFVSMDGKPVRSCCGLRLMADGTASAQSNASDLIVPGGSGVDAIMADSALQQLLQTWTAAPERRLISVCSGALLLASSGVLNGRNATTHWSRTSQVQRLFPKVNWQTDQLYISDENIYTSAGVTTGIDLSLTIIQNDHGGACALRVARELVVYMQRRGGQSQFAGVVDLQLQKTDTLSTLVNAVIQHPARTWSVPHMAEFCNLTDRTLTRHFHKHLNTSPKRFVEKIRVNSACELISAGVPLPVVLPRCGLSEQQMQRAFKRQLGTSVSDYMHQFGSQASTKQAPTIDLQ